MWNGKSKVQIAVFARLKGDLFLKKMTPRNSELKSRGYCVNTRVTHGKRAARNEQKPTKGEEDYNHVGHQCSFSPHSPNGFIFVSLAALQGWVSPDPIASAIIEA